MMQYAEPRMRLSIILGTEGHNAAGTNENDTPRMAIIATANAFEGFFFHGEVDPVITVTESGGDIQRRTGIVRGKMIHPGAM